MTVHLVIPPTGYIAQRWKQGSSMPPLGILYVAAVLEKNGIDVQVTAADVRRMSHPEIVTEIASSRASIVGITITTENRFDTFALARAVKQALPEVFLVIGGPHATMAGEDMIRHIPEIDAAVIGEGEMTMLELATWKKSGGRNEELPRIRGLMIRQEGCPAFTGPRPAIVDLDTLPHPAKHLVPIVDYNFTWPVAGKAIPAANLITSRGCPFQCNFCATPVTWGRRVRGLSPSRVIEEIRWNMERFNARYIWFYDDTFNYNPQRAAAICDEIVRLKLGIHFVAEIRIDTVNYDLLAKMKAAGCHYISFGVEAGSERVRHEIIHKNIASDRIYQVLDWAEKLQLLSTVFFIFSHPTETWPEAQETIRIMEAIRRRTEIAVSILHIYPGTELETYAREKKLIPADFTWTRHDHRVPLLPAAQGDVPLFKDRLTWSQIGELLIRWSMQNRKGSLLKKVPEALRSIRSFSDIGKYLAIAWAALKIRLKRGANR